MSRWYGYPNRTVCDVLEEMRTCSKLKNYSYLDGLIEEVQSLANRMESALSDIRDIKELRKERSDLKAEVRNLESQVEKLKKELPDEKK